MTTIKNIEVARNADRELLVEWTRNGVPVEPADTLLSIRQDPDVEIQGEVTPSSGGRLLLRFAQAELESLVPGAAQWDLLVREGGRTSRLVAGTVSVVNGAGTW